jgi:UrcA family protein
MKMLCLIAAGAAALAAATGASARSLHMSESDTTRSVAVDYSDLNLSSVRGAQALVDRVRAAANIACGETSSHLDLGRALGHRACVAAASERAIESLNTPLVSAVYEGRARHELLAGRNPATETGG